MKQEPNMPNQPRLNFPCLGEEDKTRIVKVDEGADRNNSYGLAALSLLTGKPFDLCIRAVRETFPAFRTAPIKGLDENMIVAVVPRLGYSATAVNLSESRGRAPSLIQAMYRMRHRKGQAFLIVESGSRHFLVLKGWKIYDSYCPGGIWNKQYPFRRLKVGLAWCIQNPRKQSRLPFPERPRLRNPWLLANRHLVFGGGHSD